nr:hypothetical protein [Nocardia aobensis]
MASGGKRRLVRIDRIGHQFLRLTQHPVPQQTIVEPVERDHVRGERIRPEDVQYPGIDSPSLLVSRWTERHEAPPPEIAQRVEHRGPVVIHSARLTTDPDAKSSSRRPGS